MAGMFYSIREVTEKLNKTEDEVKELVKQGRLREFRDGQNVLFKIDEVEVLLADTSFMGAKPAAEAEAVEEPTVEPAAEGGEEITLAPEEPEEVAAGMAGEADLADADTSLTGEGVNILGETDTEYKLADDTMAETKSGSGAASLEEIEEDVSLDTFGSGSGLLDLSLQADDTSLGGILDEIYTSEGQEAEQAQASGSAGDVAAEAEQMLSEEEPIAPVPAEAVVMQAYVEPEADTASNLLGVMLVLPLLALIYTAIVAGAAQMGVIPSVLRSVQGIIWPIVIGAIVVTAVVTAAALTMGGSAGSGKKAKAKKPKKTKEKKSKKGKKKKGAKASGPEAESQA